MLTLLEGGFTSNLHEELISSIERSIRSGNKVYLIVPEQQTVAAECEMSKILPPSAPLCFEVTNFTRFTNTAFRTLGGISGEYCSPVAKSLTMWRALTELAPMLSMTKGRPNVPTGTVDKALAAVAELQALGVSPESITRIAEGGGFDKRLGEKLDDIARVYDLYTRLLGEKYNDAANDAAVLADMLAASPEFLSGIEIYIDGFTSFTETQYKLIGEVMRHAPVSVALAIDPVRADSFEFGEVREAKTRLIRLADKAGCDKRSRKCRAAGAGRHPIIGEVGSLLWHSNAKIDNDSLQYLHEDGGRVRIFSASTAYEECNFVAEDIRRRVISGDKFSDFAIIARRTESYVGVLDFALEGAGVPYFFSKRHDVTASPLIKLILTAYRIVLGGFRREDVLTYLKCGLSGISERERDTFEAYVDKWSIDGKRFTDGIAWNMNPRGYTDMRDGDAERILEVNAIRDKLIEPLLTFCEDVYAARTVRDHAKALIKHLCALELEDALIARAERLHALGEIAAADESRAIWGIVCGALDAVVDVLDQTDADAESFVNQLTVALSAQGVGRIPAHRDEVTVGDADMLRTSGKKHVYLIGVNQGEFPSTVSEGTYFTERDRRTLEALELPDFPIKAELEMKNARELYSFSRAFCSATETVTLLYAQKTAMLGALLPSDVISRIVDMATERTEYESDGGYNERKTVKHIEPVSVDTLPPEARLYSPTLTLETLGRLGEEELSSASLALARAGHADKLAVSKGSIKNTKMTLGEDSLALLYHGDLYLSQTKIDSFLRCPLGYFLKHNLKLDTMEPAELGANVIGSFVHGVIEGFFKEARAIGRGIGELSEDERTALTERCAKSYISELLGTSEPDGRTRVAISRLTRATRPVIDGLCEEFSACSYEPVFFELETSMQDGSLPDHLILRADDGGRIVIKAKIDRVDTLRHGEDVYVRVVDYKTGSNSFLPSKLKEGEYLQMFLYLRALTESRSKGFMKQLGIGEGGRAVPAGVIYVKTAIADATIKSGGDEEARAAVREMQKRDGMILADPISVEAMNPDFLPPKPGPKSTKFESREYDEDGWREISETVEGVVKSVAADMKSGKICATPASRGGRGCNWCRYKEICRGAIVKDSW